MALPEFGIRDLVEAGVHFGHRTFRWNPKMKPYIYGKRNGIHIIDLTKTVPLLRIALEHASDVVSGGGRILFVCTKGNSEKLVADAAKRSAQYYVNTRWLGGMLTNWNTISKSIKRISTIEKTLADPEINLKKKERLTLTREHTNLDHVLGGIREMGGLPDLILVIDTNRGAIAVKEANKLGIPVVAVLDTNSNPDGIDFIVPGNDDSGRSIELYCDLFADAAIDGISRSARSAPVQFDDDGGDSSEEKIIEVDLAADVAALDVTVEKIISPEDLLTTIEGITEDFQRELNEKGIFQISQLAELSDKEIEKLDASVSFTGRMLRDDWSGRAKAWVAAKSSTES